MNSKRTFWICLIGAAALGAGWYLLEQAGQEPVLNSDSMDSETQAIVHEQSLPQQASVKTSIDEKRQRVAPDPVTALPQNIRTALGLEDDGSFVTRLKAVHDLGQNLNSRDRVALYAFLTDTEQPEMLTQMHVRVLKNDILNALRNQQHEPPELTHVMIGIFHDKNQDSVMRDYAIQHLHSWYPHARDKNAIRQVFQEALDETDTSIAGTSLLALYHLSQKHTEFDLSSLGDVALKLATDERCGQVSRLTAVQICGRMKERKVLPVARTLAENSRSLPVKLAAIAAIGEVGGPDDLTMLEHLATGSSTHVQTAAKSALRKLKGQREI